MNKSDNSYKSILKGTSVFGGTEFFKILITIIRGKFVAVLLGPEGMGISSLLTSSTTTLQQISGLGLNLSIVREISDKNNDKEKIISISRKLLLITGLLGGFLCVILSPWLSKISFSSSDYTLWYVALSIMIVFTTLASGESSVLQGLHEIKKLALSSLIGSIAGLCLGVPLYFFWGIKGIVPAMIVMALVSYTANRYFVHKSNVSVSYSTYKLRENKETVKKMILLGITLMISSVIGSLAVYGVNLFIKSKGSIEDIGLYQAANSLTLQYMGVIISSMALDYFPRLTAAGNNKNAMNEIVNRQSEVSVLLAGPLSACLVVFAPIVIKVLLDSKFLPIVPLIQCMSIGIYLRSVGFPIGYISFSKGDKKTFFILEGIWANILNFICPCICYYYFGLIGLGYGQIINFTIVIIGYQFILRRLYGYKPNKSVLKLTICCFFPTLLTFILSNIYNYNISLIISIPIIIISLAGSYKALKKRIKQ